MARDGHDSAGAVACEDVVGQEDGYLLPVHGVYRADALKDNAGLFLVQLRALEIGLARGLTLVGADGVQIRYLVRPLGYKGVLRAHDHIGRAEERIRPRGEDAHRVPRRRGEVHLGARGAAYPVALLYLDALDIINVVQIVQQALGILRDGQHPLALFLLDDLAAAALADAVHNLFVCQDYLAARTPVDGHGGLIRQALLVHLQEYPLGPLVIVGVRGIDHAVPVKAVTQHLQLL